MAEGRFHRPAPAAPAASAADARSSPLAFYLGVVWLVVILSGLIQWSFQYLTGNMYYLFMAAYLPYFLVLRLPQIAWLASRPQFWLWLLTVVMPVLMFVTGQSDPWAAASMKSRIIFFSFVAGSALVLVAPDGRRMLRVAALLVLAISIPLCFLELVAGSIFSVTPGRAAGFWGNPNDAGAGLLLCLLLIVDLRRPTPRGLVLAAVTTAAVFTTFSRSGMIFAMVLFAVYAVAPTLRTARGAEARSDGGQRILILGALTVAAAIGVVVLSRTIDLSDEAALRLRSVLTGDVSDTSAEGRVVRARYSMKLVRENFWGNGLGFVERREIEPHNTYLYLAIDYGIPGLLLYLTILVAAAASALRAGWARGANAIFVAALLVWTSLFTHYVAGTTFFAIAFASFITGTLIDAAPAPLAAAPAPTGGLGRPAPAHAAPPGARS